MHTPNTRLQRKPQLPDHEEALPLRTTDTLRDVPAQDVNPVVLPPAGPALDFSLDQIDTTPESAAAQDSDRVAGLVAQHPDLLALGTDAAPAESPPNPFILQPMLRVNQPGDPYEQEADRVASAVMDASDEADPIATPLASGIQRSSDDAGVAVTPEVEAGVTGLQGGGAPLPEAERSFFEPRMGADFGHVRLHTDGAAIDTARLLNARAFTVGPDIAFADGEYQPGTDAARELMAHELTHVTQQTGSIAPTRVQRRASTDAPPADEQAATPTPEQQAAARAAAAEAEAIAAAARAVGTTNQSQQQSEGASVQAEGEAPRQEASTSQARGPVSEERETTRQAEVVTSATSAAQEGSTRRAEVTATAQTAKDGVPAPADFGPLALPAGANTSTAGGTAEAATAVAQTNVQQAFDATASAADKAPGAPADDPAYQAVQTTAKAVGAQQQTHDPAQGEADEAQSAAVSPPTEITGKAQTAQVGELEQVTPPAFDAAAFKAQLMDRIAALAPTTAEEADRFKEDDTLGSVKDEMAGKASEERSKAQDPLAEQAAAAPDTSRVAPKPTTPLTPGDPGAPPPPIGAEQAVPKTKGGGEVETPLQASDAALDTQLAQAEVTEEQLTNSNEPEFTAALDSKNQAQTSTKAAPQEYRTFEQTQLTSAREAAVSTAEAQTQAMAAERVTQLGQVDAQQAQTKSADEQQREKIAGHINAIYEETKTKVDATLSALDGEVTAAFDAGATTAKQSFENFVDAKMEAYKEERYGGMFGWATWAADKLLGMPDEVNAFYDEGRTLYLEQMDAVIDKVVAIIGTAIATAQAEIARGKQRIQDYVDQLPQELQQLGQQAAQDIGGKFDQLEQNITAKQSELIDTLANKYQENLQAVDARIAELKAANKGLVDQAIEAIGGVIKAILELKNLLLSVLASAADAVMLILKDPIGFIGNLISGVAQGLNNFVSNIADHLQTGFVEWLTGTLGGVGITMPENIFSLEGVLDLVLQVLGLTWENFRDRAVGIFGAGVVGALETGLELFIVLKDEGLMGAWEWIQDKLAGMQELVIDGIKEMLISEVIEAGITWLIGLLGGPAGAFIKACKMIFDVVMWFVNNAGRIMSLVEAIIDSVTAIAQGNLAEAAKQVEEALGRFVPIAIGFLASLVGLGDLSKKVRKIIDKAQEPVNAAIDYVLNLIKGFVQKIAKMLGVGGKGGKDGDGELGKELRFDDGEESHRLWVERQGSQATVMVASVGAPLADRLTEWQSKERLDELPEEKQGEVKGLVGEAEGLLTGADALADDLADDMDRPKKLEEADQIQQKDTSLEQAEEQLAPIVKQILVIYHEAGADRIEDWLGQKLVNRNDQGDDTLIDPNFQLTGYQFVHLPRLKRPGVEGVYLYIKRSKKGPKFPQVHLDDEGVLQPGEKDPPPTSDEDKIREYQKVLRAAGIAPTSWPAIEEADQYRRQMREMVVDNYQGNLKQLHAEIIAPKLLDSQYNRVIGEIFEEWCQKNKGVIRRPVPKFILLDNATGADRDFFADGVLVNQARNLVEIKAISENKAPTPDQQQQMRDYFEIVNGVPWINEDDPAELQTFDTVLYIFSDQGVVQEWKPFLDRFLPNRHDTDPEFDFDYVREVHQTVEEAAPKTDGEGSDTTIQTKRADGAEPGVLPEDLEARVQGINGGAPLPEEERAFFETRMGADFSQVRVHTDADAAQTADDVAARAFTTGNNIVFSAGEYRPGSAEGRQLLAHELTHVIQQGQAPSTTGGLADVQRLVGGGAPPSIQRTTNLESLVSTEALRRYQTEAPDGTQLKTVKQIIDFKYGPESRDANYNPQLKVSFEAELAELVLNDLMLVSDAVQAVSNTVLLYLYKGLERGADVIRVPLEELGSAKTNLQEKLAELAAKLDEAEARVLNKAREPGAPNQLVEFNQTMSDLMQATEGQLGYIRGLNLGTDLDPLQSEACFSQLKDLLRDAPSSPNGLAMHLNMHLQFYTTVYQNDFKGIMDSMRAGAQTLGTSTATATNNAALIAQEARTISVLAEQFGTSSEQLARPGYSPAETLQPERHFIRPRQIATTDLSQLEALLTEEDLGELATSPYPVTGADQPLLYQDMSDVQKRQVLSQHYLGRPRTSTPFSNDKEAIKVDKISGGDRLPMEGDTPAPQELRPLNIDQTGVLRHVRGGDLFYIDEAKAWSQRARIELDMPVQASPSGSSALMLAAAMEMGLGAGEERMKYAMALVGSLVGGGHHSFHEIMMIARLVDVPYEDGDYMSIIRNLPVAIRARATTLINSEKYKSLLTRGGNE